MFIGLLQDERVSCNDVIGDGVFLGGVCHGKDIGNPVSVEPYNYVSRKCVLVCDVDNYRISMDVCYLLQPLYVLQETWISEYVNGISRVEENPVRADGPLLEECVIKDEEYCVVTLFVKAINQGVFIVGFNLEIIIYKHACLNGCVWVIFHQFTNWKYGTYSGVSYLVFRCTTASSRRTGAGDLHSYEKCFLPIYVLSLRSSAAGPWGASGRARDAAWR